jgi:hypothetical protein
MKRINAVELDMSLAQSDAEAVLSTVADSAISLQCWSITARPHSTDWVI